MAKNIIGTELTGNDAGAIEHYFDRAGPADFGSEGDGFSYSG